MINLPAKKSLVKALPSASGAFIVLAPFLPSAARAAKVDNCGNFLPAYFCTDDLFGFISQVANFMVGLFGALFVMMIVIAGVQMASASDSPDRLKAAKTRLTNAVIGLVLLISFRAILALFGIVIN